MIDVPLNSKHSHTHAGKHITSIQTFSNQKCLKDDFIFDHLQVINNTQNFKFYILRILEIKLDFLFKTYYYHKTSIEKIFNLFIT